jgi:hypothetical protein
MEKPRNFYGIMIMLSLVGYGWIYWNKTTNSTLASSSTCLIKKVLSIPCPSCGSTRSVLSLLEGRILDAFYLNPFGLPILVLLICIPCWIAWDFISQTKSLYILYGYIEKEIQKKPYPLILIFLVIGNWIWNIKKGI